MLISPFQGLETDFKNEDFSACKVVIVKTIWNQNIVDSLYYHCVETLKTYGVLNVITIDVPGAVEIPFVVSRYWKKKDLTIYQPSVFIVLGCVIKGDTPHFDYVCQMVSQGILTLNLSLDVPTIMGVLTVNNLEQALERTGQKNNKGKEFALTALQMFQINQKI